MSSLEEGLNLSDEQAAYLRSATYLPQALREASSTVSAGGRSIHMDALTIDLLQQALTERLAYAGFDANYELTQEGSILEGIIDVLGSAGTFD